MDNIKEIGILRVDGKRLWNLKIWKQDVMFCFILY